MSAHNRCYFPVIPGETVYGYIARYHTLSGHSAGAQSYAELLGNPNYQPNAEFPSGLPCLSVFMQRDAVEIAREMTSLNYYAPFLNQDVHAWLCSALASGRTQTVKTKTGHVACGLSNQGILRHCPICTDETIRIYGMPSWYVAHQLPGVTVCPHHVIYLEHVPYQRKVPSLPEKNVSARPANRSTAAFRFAHLSMEMLRERMRPLRISRLKGLYRNSLESSGLVTKSGSIRLASLRERIQSFWRSDKDEKLNTAINETLSDASYPDVIFRGRTKNLHPVKHLLLIGPLFNNLKQFLMAYHQLGLQFPEVCNQTTTSHAHHLLADRESKILAQLSKGASLRSVSNSAKVSISTTKAIAVSHQIPISRRTSKVSSTMYRDIWRKLFIGRRTEHIAEYHAISKGSVEQVLREHPYLKQLRAKVRFSGTRTIHRAHLTSWVKEHPTLYRNMYKITHNAHYTWLYRSDRLWLDESLPKPIPRNRRRSHPKSI